MGLSIILFVSCAQPGYLTGGDKDVSAPQVGVEDTVSNRKKEFPPNKTTQFTAERIEIHYDELIALKDEKKQIVITPTLETAPIFEVKGKKLFVIFESQPKPNTTYIINFGDAIRDVTEGNIFSNYKYVFSTGTYIDSLQYKAFVNDAYSKLPVADAWVMLYQKLEDSIPLQEKPYYFAKTNANGYCTIENIATGTYKSFVLEDKNSNYQFDQVIEKIGFSENSIQLKDSITLDTFALFTNYSKKGKLNNIKIQKNGSLIIPLPHPANGSLNLNKGLLTHFWKDTLLLNDSKDTITGWVKPNSKETKSIKFLARNYQSATFRTNQPSDSILTFKTNGARKLKPNEKLYLDFSQPIEAFDPSKINFLINNKEVNYETTILGTKIIVDADFHPDSSYIINAFPSAVKSIYGITNDSLTVFFNAAEPNNFGNVLLNITDGNKTDLIVELLEKGKIIERRKLNKVTKAEVTFKNLEPNTYNIRIIQDENQNGVWDTGNYFLKSQPEKITYYSDPIDVRKGWDLDLTWQIK